MAKITIERILEKYHKIFVNYPGNPSGVNWTGVPEGWLPIIDKLCGSIQEYIDSVYTLVDNPEYIEGKQFNIDDITTKKYLKQYHPQVTCTQMKEKFGGLRFYVSHSNDQINGMIRMAEYLCDHTCDRCGSEENLGVTTGWISVCCKDCAIKEGRDLGKSWMTKDQLKQRNKDGQGSTSLKQSDV